MTQHGVRESRPVQAVRALYRKVTMPFYLHPGAAELAGYGSAAVVLDRVANVSGPLMGVQAAIVAGGYAVSKLVDRHRGLS